MCNELRSKKYMKTSKEKTIITISQVARKFIQDMDVFLIHKKKSETNIIKTTWLTSKYPEQHFSMLPKSIVAKQVSIVDTNQTPFFTN